MDRFSWVTSSTQLQEGEKVLGQQSGIRLYDEDRKVIHDYVKYYIGARAMPRHSTQGKRTF